MIDLTLIEHRFTGCEHHPFAKMGAFPTDFLPVGREDFCSLHDPMAICREMLFLNLIIARSTELTACRHLEPSGIRTFSIGH
jgi:hypothetical protein